MILIAHSYSSVKPRRGERNPARESVWREKERGSEELQGRAQIICAGPEAHEVLDTRSVGEVELYEIAVLFALSQNGNVIELP